VSFYEIYCGKLFDLLNKRNLIHAREDAKQRVKIMGIVETTCNNLEDLMSVINFGL
jgi:kinesin family protein 2/24